ncbi:GNAT family N-acetyltransferase [Vicingaceae bacterium]|nr:GNAT family N-acetyltransferase [Vicingaceae bacterium]
MENNHQHIISHFYSFFEFLAEHSSSKLNHQKSFESIKTGNSSWPNFTYNLKLEDSNIEDQLSEITTSIDKKEVPNFIIVDDSQLDKYETELSNSGFIPLAEWVCLKLEKLKVKSQTSDNIEIKKIKTEDELRTWVEIASIGFGKLDFDLFFTCFNKNEITFYGAYNDAKMVATSLLLFNNNTAGIYHVVTRPEFRKKGIGSQLFQYCQKEALNDGATSVIAQSTQEGLNAWLKTGMKHFGNFYLLCWSKPNQ